MLIVNKNDALLPIEVQEGENLTLVARLSQEKASVRWLKNMRPLYPGPQVVMSSEGPVRSLIIRQAEPGDSGTLSCDTGDDEVHFTTYVRGKLDPPLPSLSVLSHYHFRPASTSDGEVGISRSF